MEFSSNVKLGIVHIFYVWPLIWRRIKTSSNRKLCFQECFSYWLWDAFSWHHLLFITVCNGVCNGICWVGSLFIESSLALQWTSILLNIYYQQGKNGNSTTSILRVFQVSKILMGERTYSVPDKPMSSMFTVLFLTLGDPNMFQITNKQSYFERILDEAFLTIRILTDIQCMNQSTFGHIFWTEQF